MYSKEVEKYFGNPINMGIIENANGICSDIIEIYIKVNEKNIIEDAKFQAKGCPPVIAACCVVTGMIKNMDIDEAKNITTKEIIEKLNGLPKEKEHCAELVEKTLHKVLNDYKSKNLVK